MASKEKHIQKYNKNKQVFNSELFNIENNFDWKVTIIFYAAVHLIEGSIDGKTKCTSHKDRYDIVNRSFRKIIDDYENLYKLSKKARYNCVKIKEYEVDSALMSLRQIESNISV